MKNLISIRLPICQKCPHYSANHFCNAFDCGCKLPISLNNPDEECPLGKWDASTNDEELEQS